MKMFLPQPQIWNKSKKLQLLKVSIDWYVGSGCSSAVEHAPRKQKTHESMGSNPNGCLTFFFFLTFLSCHGRELAQLVERPSRGPGSQCNSTVGSIPGCSIGVRKNTWIKHVLATPSGDISPDIDIRSLGEKTPTLFFLSFLALENIGRVSQKRSLKEVHLY